VNGSGIFALLPKETSKTHQKILQKVSAATNCEWTRRMHSFCTFLALADTLTALCLGKGNGRSSAVGAEKRSG
jgi:hypothetical protein